MDIQRQLDAWEEDGTLPEGGSSEAADLRATLLALDLCRHQVTESDVQKTVLRALNVVPFSTPKGVRRHVAALRRDLSGFAPSVRSAVSEGPTVFETDDYVVTVSWAPNEPLRGSVYPKSRSRLPEGATVTVRGLEESIEVGPNGAFEVPELGTDTIQLLVLVEDQLIELAPLERP